MGFPSIGGIVKKNCLGVDIGSSSIKIVELSRTGERIKLEAYGEIRAEAIYQKPFRSFEKNTILFQTMDIARAIAGIIDEAKMVSRKAVFSIPDFSTFYTTFDLPPMSLQEVSQAVRFRARQYIPLPLNEVSLDWLIIEGEAIDHKRAGLRVLLVAVPNEIINQYQEIVKICVLELYALEAEVFGLLRAVGPEKRKTVAIIDIGAQSVTCSLVENRVLKQSRSFEPAGNEIVNVLSKALMIESKEAEFLMKQSGILPPSEINKGRSEKAREVILTIVDAIFTEAKRTLDSFAVDGNPIPESIIIAGGIANLPGLKEYFSEKFAKEVEIINPFTKVFYPPILEKSLREMGPSFAIALGSAMRGLE